MSKNFPFKMALSFLFAVLIAATVSAQTNSCAVRTEIFLNSSETVITGASVTAVHIQTEKMYKSVLKDGMPFFANLPKGDYFIIAGRAGYKKTVEERFLECAAEDNNEDVWSFELWEGSSKEMMRVENRLDFESMTENPSIISGTIEQNAPAKTNTERPVVGTISAGVLNSKATNLVKPAYPAAAKAVRASGAVNVQVTIDESGKVISASAVSGHPLLRGAAEAAAKASTFPPTLLSGQPVKVTGIIVYNFVLPEPKKENQ